MPKVITSTVFEKWDEDRTLTTIPRITPAHTIFTLPEVKGKAVTEYLMIYTPDGNASFVYAETVTVESFDGKSGSFMTLGKGLYNGKEHKATATFEIVEGSGTGELRDIKGSGVLEATPEHKYVYEVTF